MWTRQRSKRVARTVFDTMRHQLVVARAARTIQSLLTRRDPVTLSAIRTPLVLVRHTSSIVFDAHALAGYIDATGDLEDPITRTCYSTPELLRIARLCALPHRTFVNDRDARLKKRREEQGRRSLEDALVYEMGQRVWDFVHQASTVNDFMVFRDVFLQCYSNLMLLNSVGCTMFARHTLAMVVKDKEFVLSKPVLAIEFERFFRRLC